MLREDQINFLNAYGDFFKKNFTDVDNEIIIRLHAASKYLGYPEEPAGSIFTSEGKSIYVLIRLLQPKRILEIGNFLGRSSNFILKAVEDNGFGDVTLLDIEERLEFNKLHNRNFNRVINDSLKYLDNPLDFDLIVQDGCHEYQHVKKELNLISTNNKPNFWIWSHDYYKILPPQCEVKRAWDEVIKENKHFTIFQPMIEKTSNCGLVIAKHE
jgi:SAM-dependent methyltransferase